MRIIFSIIFILSFSIFGDPSKPKKIENPKSKCIVEVSGGEYPMYVIKNKVTNKVIYAPKSDGVSGVAFSPSGKLLALTGSEIDNVDILDKRFAIVILNCENGTIKGYLEVSKIINYKTIKWDKLEKNIEFTLYDPKDEKNENGKLNIDLKLNSK